MTIFWHVDDLKISYANLKAVDKVVNWLDNVYSGIKAKLHKETSMNTWV